MFIVKNCWGTPVPGRVCASKPWSFSSACKNLSQFEPKYVFPILDSSICSRDTCNQSLKLSKVNPNFTRFSRQLFWRGGPPKFLDLSYKTIEPSDHVAKFRGHWPTELGDLALKKKKTSAVKQARLELLFRAA